MEQITIEFVNDTPDRIYPAYTLPRGWIIDRPPSAVPPGGTTPVITVGVDPNIDAAPEPFVVRYGKDDPPDNGVEIKIVYHAQPYDFKKDGGGGLKATFSQRDTEGGLHVHTTTIMPKG